MYLGSRKIKSTDSEDGRVAVTFEDGSTEKFSKKMFDNLTSEEERDESDFRLTRCLFLEQQLYNVLLEHDAKLSDIEYISQRLPGSVADNYKKAVNKLWGKEEDEGKTLREVHDILQN